MTAEGAEAPSLVRLRTFSEPTGVLTVGEFPAELPFVPHRVFAVSGVPAGAWRARHAHRTCTELLVMAAGECVVERHTATAKDSFHLDDPARALLVPPGNWIVCRNFTPGSVLVVLASAAYDPHDQIRDHEEYLRWSGAGGPAAGHSPI